MIETRLSSIRAPGGASTLLGVLMKPQNKKEGRIIPEPFFYYEKVWYASIIYGYLFLKSHNRENIILINLRYQGKG